MDSKLDDITLASIDERLDQIVNIFYLETGDRTSDCDILQIAVKYGNHEFSTYVRPSKTISYKASAVNGLQLLNGNLKCNGKTVITVSLEKAIIGLYSFLFSLRRKCVLTAHDCIFD